MALQITDQKKTPLT